LHSAAFLQQGKIMISVLFVRRDSAYKRNPALDVYDADRDALTFKGENPVIAHPPCRSWGKLAHMAKPREGERELALWAVDRVRANGGILEHPKGSRLWREANLPIGDEIDEYGGFTLEVDQYDFGHVAPKKTLLYIVGISRDKLPALPPKNMATPTRSIAGNIKGTIRCTQYQREYTPQLLIDFLTDICKGIDNAKR
jgi:hypothetical protein